MKEVPRCLLADDDRIAAAHAQEWKKRRNPEKAQYDAKEPDRQKFAEEKERKRKHRIAVSHHAP